MKKIMVTGCSGYIGSHLCKMLKDDYEVHGLDIDIPHGHFVDKHITQFNLLDINKELNFADHHYDAVIHLAALVNVGESERKPIQYYITNVNGTMNVISKIKCDNFIFASTGAAESCDSAYGVSKRAAEQIVTEYFTSHKPTPHTIFRFYNVIGSAGYKPTNPDGLMYNLMQSVEKQEFTIYGNDYDTPDGTCVRDYVHVNEICEAIKIAIEQPANSVECLGHGVGHSVSEMIDLFKSVNKDLIGKKPIHIMNGPRRKGDTPYSVLNNVSPYMKNLYSIEDLLRLP